MSLIDSCITQLEAQGPSRTCNDSKEEEEVATNEESPRGGVLFLMSDVYGYHVGGQEDGEDTAVPEREDAHGDGDERGEDARETGFGFRVSGFRFRVSGFRFRVSGFGFEVSGLGVGV